MEAVYLHAMATATPATSIETSALLDALGDRLSDGFRRSVHALGVARRQTVLADPIGYLSRRTERVLDETTVDIAARAARRCLEAAAAPPRVGLLLGATNTPARQLPGLSSELVPRLAPHVATDVNVVNMQAQGCSVMPKAIEVAGWFLSQNRDRSALLVVSEAQTPMMFPFAGDTCMGPREIAGLPPAARDAAYLRSGRGLQSFLFGDGAVALLLDSREGAVAFRSFHHRTNMDVADVELFAEARSLDGARCADTPAVAFAMSPRIPERGVAYAARVAHDLQAAGQQQAAAPPRSYLIHTGSRKILDGVCRELGVDPDGGAARTSYRVLASYGNLSGASTGFMLADPALAHGPGVMVTFGSGFSASSMRFVILEPCRALLAEA